MKKKDFIQGAKDGLPIMLGYLAVSFSLGIMVVSGGLSVFQGALMSLTNVTSAGEFAGVKIIIAGGTNRSQIQALSDNVEEKLGRAGYPSKQVEGYDTANWILLDFQDIIVHIFDKENRLLYDLERIWRDGKQIDPKDI